MLDSFAKLKYLTYGCPGKSTVLPYAARQLEAVASACNLVNIVFDIIMDREEEELLDQHTYRTLDDLLSGDRFPSLQSVGLHKTSPPKLFPKLDRLGRLYIFPQSFWADPPVMLDDDCRGVR